MADPKYAGLPGIATDQPDTYETFSDPETDPEEDSCSEVSESLHMSSLSCVGADLEIVEQGTKESLMQKFTRLHCEVNELSEDLNCMTESVREGSLAGLHLQVDKLREELELLSSVSQNDSDTNDFSHSQISSHTKLIQQLQQQIAGLKADNSEGGEACFQYDLYLKRSTPLDPDIISKLDKRLARLENAVGSQQMPVNKVLSVKTDNLPLTEALKLLQSKKHTLSTDHLTHIEGRLSALTTKLNALKEQKDRLNDAKSASQVARIFNSLEANVGMISVIPEVEDRMQDIIKLNNQATQWNGRLSEINSDQERTESLLVENTQLLQQTKDKLSDSLQGVTNKLENLQADLISLKT